MKPLVPVRPMALLNIRPATVADAGLILHFIRELAIYEKAEHSVQTDEIGIAESLFGADATARALICEADGEPIGYAVYFYNYSTWLGRKGIYLKTCTSARKSAVRAPARLLKYIARQAVAEGCGRFEWSVLDWNTPAIEFYTAAGAQPQDEWTVYRLRGQALHDFANG
jgi:GNAT superfamily N-acetyltransferase